MLPNIPEGVGWTVSPCLGTTRKAPVQPLRTDREVAFAATEATDCLGYYFL